MEPTQQGTPVSEVGEFGLIAHLRDALGNDAAQTTPQEARADVLAGISDDAAVVRPPGAKEGGRVQVFTTDALIEGTHFDRSFMPMDHLGVKALSVNVSDVVAMNAEPRYALVTLGLPRGVSVEEARQLYNGLRQASEAYGVAVIGGDTTSAPRLTLSVAVIGEAMESEIVYRRGARPGDALCVTGDLGAAYAGLKVLLQERRRLQERQRAADFQPDLERFAYVVQRQLAPSARLGVVRNWKELGVRPNALIDVSDGLASEVHHLCEAGGVGAAIYGASLPLHPQTRQAADAFGEDVDAYPLFGGEDYELLFAMPEEDLDRLDETTFTQVGAVTPEEDGVRLQPPGSDEFIPLRPGGFDHFEEGASRDQR